MHSSALAIKREIENKLATRIPAALSPVALGTPRLQLIDKEELDDLLDGGFPLGSLCEITGHECSGRSSIAFAVLASVSSGGACAYIDVSDTCSPHAAAAAGVNLQNLLWVRFSSSQAHQPDCDVRSSQPLDTRRERQQLNQQSCGGPHPRGETKGLAPALQQMLVLKDERRQRKMEGTPGYPNQPLGLSQPSADQIKWEQFNFRRVDDRDPLRRMDKAAAEAARQRIANVTPEPSRNTGQKKSWTLLDRALRAADQVLQAGGFRVVVLDLGSLTAEQAQRIPSATWWRFQKAAKASDAIFLVLSSTPCARSSASCVLECSSGETPRLHRVLSSTQRIVQVSRQRKGQQFGKKAPGRVTSWHVEPAWMKAVGR